MPSHRTERLNEAIREVVASAILFEVHDPRVQGVTILSVETSADARHAVVRVTVMGDQGRQHLALRGLQSSAGFLQKKLASRLRTRYTPILSFELDQGVKNSIAMSRLIDETLAADRLAQTEAQTGSEDNTSEEPSAFPQADDA